MKIILVILLIAIAPSYTFAEDNWVQISSTKNTIYYFNPDKIDVVEYTGKPMIKAWVKTEEVSVKKGKEGKLNGTKTLILYYFDCRNNQLGMKSATQYKNNLPVQGNSFNLNIVKMNDAIPDTIGESLINAGCAS